MFRHHDDATRCLDCGSSVCRKDDAQALYETMVKAVGQSGAVGEFRAYQVAIDRCHARQREYNRSQL